VLQRSCRRCGEATDAHWSWPQAVGACSGAERAHRRRVHAWDMSPCRALARPAVGRQHGDAPMLHHWDTWLATPKRYGSRSAGAPSRVDLVLFFRGLIIFWFGRFTLARGHVPACGPPGGPRARWVSPGWAQSNFYKMNIGARGACQKLMSSAGDRREPTRGAHTATCGARLSQPSGRGPVHCKPRSETALGGPEVLNTRLGATDPTSPGPGSIAGAIWPRSEQKSFSE
jgi:hypothetical protein